VEDRSNICRQNISLLLTLALALTALGFGVTGCGSDSGTDTTATTAPGTPRYFGDHPGEDATGAAIRRDDCRALRRAVAGQGGRVQVAEADPTPPASRCVLAGGGLLVSFYLDAAYAARQRYLNRMTETVQFNAPDPARIPHAVRGVGDRSAGEHTASWIPAYSTLYAVRGNRWITVAYSVPALPRAERKVRATALAREAFRLTAR